MLQSICPAQIKEKGLLAPFPGSNELLGGADGLSSRVSRSQRRCDVFIYGFCIRGRSRDDGDSWSLRILDYRQAI